MRQGNGSDFLGANDPRSTTIGVIYVAPNDDGESVLAAILTQEKLGRKQIAIVLPNQNKAFQRPGDFEGLKSIRRRLQANLVIVAPHGSGPAEFARQRRFTYYTSLESFGRSLREENEASRVAKRGWFGARNPRRAAGESAAVDDKKTPGLPHSNGSQDHVQPPSEKVDDRTDEQHGINAAAMGIGIGAAGLEADHLLNASRDKDLSEASPAHDAAVSDNDHALSAPEGVTSSTANGVPAQDHVQQPLSSQAPVQNEPADIITFPQPSPTREAGSSSMPQDMSGDEEEPGATALPPPTQIGRRNSGKVPVVGAASAGVGAGMAGRNVTTGGVPPMGGNAGGANTGGPRRRRSGWQLLVAALIVLLVLSLLLCGGLAVAAPGTFGNFGSSVSHVFSGAPPSATVTITPKSADLHNTYVITGLTTGTPDSSKRQVRARVLTPAIETQAKTVPATGVLNFPATPAKGTLTFYNGNGVDEVVKASTFALSVNGVQIKLTADVDIPAAPGAGQLGVKDASAFADPPGANGNIAAGTINQFCCGNTAISVKNNNAFGGGQNAYTRSVVQQSDINNAANPLKGALQQAALSSPNLKKQAGEQFLPNQPQCNTSVTSRPGVGQQSSSVTVTVNVTCSGEVYDQSGAQAITSTLLKGEAAKATGPNYALAGNVVTTVTQAMADSKGKVTLSVRAEGIWVYQISAAQKMQLAKLIAGKTQGAATALLLQQAGVDKVNSISLSSGTTLPTDANLITIVVQPVPGVQGTVTPTGSPGPGTPTTLTSPVPRPSPSVVPGK